ncbi:TetR/AcrR family transcriptional regulator [Leptospira ilyithenensis]|uniref:TetR/AcrR family transcriptional regulator n=1 Tax=Leptospira ilyithenensis TaxID=2484901 RepID=A0A4R9LPE0_9LEPT|nr:TetR/AcrR family transcriptional regulator [Leptospira ilyithenensis]TGN09679.1 TetR/AcrR family transcriptional regulator [Leptospira ilyithenensis]
MNKEKQDANRTRILAAAERLLKSIGRDAITIRAVADEAKVQLPTIYRLFGDKSGLLDAIAEHGFVRYMKIRPKSEGTLNPIEELRAGWDIHVRFGLENPELYGLMYGESYSGRFTPAAQIAYDGLKNLIIRLATSGCLKVSQEEATFSAFASASGVVLTMLSWPDFLHENSYYINIRESMISSITTESYSNGDEVISNALQTLGANLKDLNVLSQNEKNLLQEWLKRSYAKFSRLKN